MDFITGWLIDESLSMTVDRAGSFDCPRGLLTGLVVLFFGLVSAGLLVEAATRLGPSPVVFLFFSTIDASNDGFGVFWLLTYSERVLRERE